MRTIPYFAAITFYLQVLSVCKPDIILLNVLGHVVNR